MFFDKKFTKKNIFFGLLLIFVMLSLFFIKYVGEWMMVSDPLPQKIDVIFTFSGENVRDQYSRELFNIYKESLWIVSCWYDKEKYIGDLESEGYDTSRIFTVDTCSNTYSEVMFLKMYLRENYKDDKIVVGLVSGPYHMARIALITKKMNFSPRHSIRYLPVPKDRYVISYDVEYFKNWWRTKLMLFEMIKIFKDMMAIKI